MNIFEHENSKDSIDRTDEDNFGQRPIYTYYKSNSVLGRLYRRVSGRKIWKGNAQWTNSSLSSTEAFWDQLLDWFLARVKPVGVAYWRYHLDRAKQLYDASVDLSKPILHNGKGNLR
jgi:hypothetical protein